MPLTHGSPKVKPSAPAKPQPKNATRIRHRLFLGNARCAKDSKFLTSNKITMVVTLLGKTELERHMKAIPADVYKNIEHKTYTVEDVPSADLLSILTDAMPLIRAHDRGENRILVHCMQGKSRSATTVAAYQAFRGASGRNVDEIVEKLKSKRPILDINTGFIVQLHYFVNFCMGALITRHAIRETALFLTHIRRSRSWARQLEIEGIYQDLSSDSIHIEFIVETPRGPGVFCKETVLIPNEQTGMSVSHLLEDIVLPARGEVNVELPRRDLETESASDDEGDDDYSDTSDEDEDEDASSSEDEREEHTDHGKVTIGRGVSSPAQPRPIFTRIATSAPHGWRIVRVTVEPRRTPAARVALGDHVVNCSHAGRLWSVVIAPRVKRARVRFDSD